MFKIIDSQMIAPNMHLLKVEAPEVARAAQPGQFVILRAEEDGERVPLTISDWDVEEGTVTVVFMNVGVTTGKLASLETGMSLPTVVGPLGNPMEIDHFGTVLLVGGCYGIASIYPVARALREKGNRIVAVIEARSSFLLFWQDKLKKISDKFICITRDGSQGMQGHIHRLPEVIASLGSPVDRIIINGCNYLMMRGAEESKPLNIKTIVSLNTLMIDGTGMCGVCRVTLDGKTKFACVDGPHFDGHLVDWEELTQRRKAYLREEVVQLHTSSPL